MITSIILRVINDKVQDGVKKIQKSTLVLKTYASIKDDDLVPYSKHLGMHWSSLNDWWENFCLNEFYSSNNLFVS